MHAHQFLPSTGENVRESAGGTGEMGGGGLGDQERACPTLFPFSPKRGPLEGVSLKGGALAYALHAKFKALRANSDSVSPFAVFGR